ncbi:MAG: hypothetical protein ACJ75S_04310 [Solirubrobacterales bacterium]
MFSFPAQIGPATSLLEAAATSIGAGMLVSGFVMAVLGLARRRTRGQIEKNSLRDACVGGLVATWLIILDLSMRYFV